MATGSNNIETLMLHAGSHRRDLTTNSVAVPIYQTTSYEFDNAAHRENCLHYKSWETFIPALRTQPLKS